VPKLVFNYTVAVLRGSCCSVVGRPAVVSCCVCQPVVDPEVLVNHCNACFTNAWLPLHYWQVLLQL